MLTSQLNIVEQTSVGDASNKTVDQVFQGRGGWSVLPPCGHCLKHGHSKDTSYLEDIPVLSPYKTVRPVATPAVFLSGVNWQQGIHKKSFLYALVTKRLEYGGAKRTAAAKLEARECTGIAASVRNQTYFYDWMAPNHAHALLEVDVSSGGAHTAVIKDVDIPKGEGLSVMSMTAVIQPDSQQVQVFTSFRVEKSDDTTGCSCKGHNITHTANYLTRSTQHPDLIYSVTQRSVDWSPREGQCHGGTRYCSELWFWDSSKKRAERFQEKTNYYKRTDQKHKGCKMPPAIILPNGRFPMTGSEYGHRGEARFCDKACMKDRTLWCNIWTEQGWNLSHWDKKFQILYPGWRKSYPNYAKMHKSTGIASHGGMQPLEPLGFLSRLGAEGGAGAHILKVWQGPAGKQWLAKDNLTLPLSLEPRQRNNLAKAAYPLTRLFSHNERVFMLQVMEDTQPTLLLENVRVCGETIQRTPVARLMWPREVLRRMDFLCRTYANEEATLQAASPSILYNVQYKTYNLVLNVRNRVYAYELTPQLSAKCLNGCSSCEQPNNKTLRNINTVATLAGRSNQDFLSSVSTAQVNVHGEKLYILSSYNIIQSIDLSLAVPCGQLMDFFRHHFQEWTVKPGFKATKTKTVQLFHGGSAQGSPHGANWTLSITKQVNIFEGAELVKNTVCCSPVTEGPINAIPCCVEKQASDYTETLESKLAQEVGSM